MFCTRKKKQSNRRLFSQLDDLDPDFFIGSTMSDRQVNATVNEGTVDQKFTFGISDSKPALNEKLVKVKILERYFFERIDRERVIVVDTVKDRIQNDFLTAIDSMNTPKIELNIRSSGQYVTSIMESSEHLETPRCYCFFWKRIR